MPGYAKRLGGVLLAAATIGGSAARTAPHPRADAVYGGYLRAYLVRSGDTTYFKSALGTAPADAARDYMWRQAEDITAIEDYWYLTSSPDAKALIARLLDTFVATNRAPRLAPGDFSWDRYNDDIGWATIAFATGYAITGNPAYLNVARTNFETVWKRGWDAAGGGVREVGGGDEGGKRATKTILATGTFIVTGVALYQATGDPTYLDRAETAYAWARANAMNMSDAANAVGDPGQVIEGTDGGNRALPSRHIYNQGLMLEAAAALRKSTGDAAYLDDATRIAAFTMRAWPIYTEQSDMFSRGLHRFAKQNGLLPRYAPYLSANADASWRQRRTDYDISREDFLKPTGLVDVPALRAISSLTIQAVTGR